MRVTALIAGVMTLPAAAGTCCAIWLAAQAPVEPYVVEINTRGDVLSVHRLAATLPNDRAITEALVGRFGQ
jgi:type IV secretory pathway TrbF-like protein